MFNKMLFDQIINLIKVLSLYAWPLTIFMIAIIYKEAILKRKIKIKFGDKEIELGELIDKFRSNVKELEQTIPEKFPDKGVESEKILQESIDNPRLGIILLFQQLEKEIKELYSSMGLLNYKEYISPPDALNNLVQKGYVSKNTISSFEIFEKLRNTLIHGAENIENKEIIQVLDIGMTLLKTLQSIPHEKHFVYNPGVDIYSDPECKTKIINAKGLILKSTSPGGIKDDLRIFPTTRFLYYKRGKQVAWEWNMTNVWQDAWYRDLKNKKIKLAWNSSAEFIGRHIEEL